MENTRDKKGAGKKQERNEKLRKERRVVEAELKVLKEKADKAVREKSNRGSTKAQTGLFRYLKPVENFSQFSYEEKSSAAQSADVDMGLEGLENSLPRKQSNDTRYVWLYI